MSNILLIKTGATMDPIMAGYGDFEDWFAAGLGPASVSLAEVYRQQSLPRLDTLASDYDGIVITGSAAMVSERADWSERTAAWLKRAVASGIPVLGVCYGHQLLAHALGGRVGANPRGRQIGTVRAQLLPKAHGDPLLGFLPAEFTAQASHSEIVLALPRGAERLAVSPKDDNFALRFSANAWGVQFHPEFSAAVTGEYIRLRADALRGEGLDPASLKSRLEETEQARAVLRQFLKIASGEAAAGSHDRSARPSARGAGSRSSA
jgi:GMP synthase (glutamine-hydrolysing)